MMTSSNGNIFRFTGPLCGEFTGLRWIPRTKASDAELWCFLWSAPWINTCEAGDMRCYRAQYDVIVMQCTASSLMWLNHFSTELTCFAITEEVAQHLWCLQGHKFTAPIQAELFVFFPFQITSEIMIETPTNRRIPCEGRWTWVWRNNASLLFRLVAI